MAHLVAGEILEYNETTGKLEPVAGISAGSISGKSDLGAILGAMTQTRRKRRRKRPAAHKLHTKLTPGQIRAARLARIKKRAELRAARIAAAKKRKLDARKRHLTAAQRREMRRHPEARHGAEHFGATPGGKFQTNLTLTNINSAKRLLKPRGLRNTWLLYRSARAGNRKALATIQRLNAIASLPVTPANTGKITTARATLTALAAFTTGMMVNSAGKIAPITNINFSESEAQQPQPSPTARGAGPAFVPQSDAAPTASEAAEMAPTEEMQSEGEAEEESNADALETLEDVDQETTEEADDAEQAVEQEAEEEEKDENPEGETEEEPSADTESAESSSDDEPPVMGYADLGAALCIGEWNPEVGFSLRKIVRGAGRGIAKGAKGAARGVSKGVKGVVKAHVFLTKLTLKGFKAVGAGVARIAAAPIRFRVKTLANRRSKYLAWKNRGSRQPNAAENKQGAAYAIAKVNRMGPLGKMAVFVLHHTRRGSALIGWPLADIAGVPRTRHRQPSHEMTNEEAWGTQTRSAEQIARDYAERPMKKAYRNRRRYDDSSGWPLADIAGGVDPGPSYLGMTGVEIAGVAAAVVTALTAVIAKSNKPGEAPANPYTQPGGGEESSDTLPESMQEAPSDEPAPEASESSDDDQPAP